MSIKSLSYDDHKLAKIRCLYGRRVTLKLKKEEEEEMIDGRLTSLIKDND